MIYLCDLIYMIIHVYTEYDNICISYPNVQFLNHVKCRSTFSQAFSDVP